VSKDEFLVLIADLAKYYGKKTPDYDTRAMWYQKCERIPGGEVRTWISDRVTDRLDAWPSNLPNILNGFWYEWQRLNPEKMAKREFSCRQPRCQEGFVFVVRGHNSFVFRCGECNSRPEYQKFPMGVLRELLGRGYKVDDVAETQKRQIWQDPGLFGKVAETLVGPRQSAGLFRERSISK